MLSVDRTNLLSGVMVIAWTLKLSASLCLPTIRTAPVSKLISTVFLSPPTAIHLPSGLAAALSMNRMGIVNFRSSTAIASVSFGGCAGFFAGLTVGVGAAD